MKKKRRLLLVAFSLVCLSSRGLTADEYNWQYSTPEQQGVDSHLLTDALNLIREQDIPVHSVIMLRNGKLILEAYIHPYDRDTQHNIRSVTKSISSAAVGIALDKNFLESVKQPITDFFPEIVDPLKRQITLRHLMTMSAGLDLDSDGPKEQEIYQSDDWIGTTLQVPMAVEPGERFQYASVLNYLMSAVLTEATGMSLQEFAMQYLFAPLSIEPGLWPAGPEGHSRGGSEMRLRPRDMAKLGQLYLDRGVYAGRQLVPAAWVEESTRNQVSTIDDRGTIDEWWTWDKRSYGYWWWLYPEELNRYYAWGLGGQFIGIDTSTQTVLVMTMAGDNRQATTVSDAFYSAVKSNAPLKGSPDATAELHSLIDTFADPKPAAVPPLPELAKQISGRRFLIDDASDLSAIQFEFEEGKSTALMSIWFASSDEATPDVYEIGLDGIYRLTDSKLNIASNSQGDALRGRWVSSNQLLLENDVVGTGLMNYWAVQFTDVSIHVVVDYRNLGQTFSYKGNLIQ